MAMEPLLASVREPNITGLVDVALTAFSCGRALIAEVFPGTEPPGDPSDPLTVMVTVAVEHGEPPTSHTVYVNESVPTKPGAGVNVNVPSGFTTAVPRDGPDANANVAPTGAPSFPATDPDTGTPADTANESSMA